MGNPRTSPAQFLREQQMFAFIAVVVYLALWSLSISVSPLVTIVYSFVLGNGVSLLLNRFSWAYCDRPFPYDWLVFLTLLIAFIPIPLVVAAAILYWAVPQPISFTAFVARQWQFPAFVAVVSAIVYNAYRMTQRRLETRNLQLQQTIAVETATREIQEQELQRAREIQQSLLPKRIPQMPGFEIVAAWEPARTVGGDYFDVIQLSPTKLAVCIADVVGKGVSAALLMANVQATVRAFASESASPAWLCTRVNNVLSSNIASDKFVTFFYGVLDSDTRELRYSNAGHLPPMVSHASGAYEELDAGGLVLGIAPNYEYQEGTLRLREGDRLVLFTDGITEASDSRGEEFGTDRIAVLTADLRESSPSHLQDRLLSEVRRFCHSQLDDDATLLIVGVNATAATVSSPAA